MPLDLSNIRDYNPRQFIVENKTNGNISIGDIKIVLPPGGSIDLLKLDSITKKPIRTFDQIANSRDLELMSELDKIDIITEEGRLTTIDDEIAAGEKASLLDTTSAGGGGITGFTEGSVIFANSSGNADEDNPNFFWNDTLNSLKVGSSTASGSRSFAQGGGTTASGSSSHAEGNDTTASGTASHAEGYANTASGYAAHSEGYGTIASGARSHAEGYGNRAYGASSHAEGSLTRTFAQNSHTEGYQTKAFGNNSHVEGNGTYGISGQYASGADSHAEGRRCSTGYSPQTFTVVSTTVTLASGNFTLEFADGDTVRFFSLTGGAAGTLSNTTRTISSVAYNAGPNTTTFTISSTLSDRTGGSCVSTSKGIAAHAEGDYNVASGTASHAEGYNSVARGYASHSEGMYGNAYGQASHNEGYNTAATGDYGSHSEGWNSAASGDATHAEGRSNTASGDYGSHAEGFTNTASGPGSHAEGYGTTASGDVSHTEGYSTIASGSFSHARGYLSEARGKGSTAIGNMTYSLANASFSSGYYSVAAGSYSVAWGSYSYALGFSSTALGGGNARGSNSFVHGGGSTGANPTRSFIVSGTTVTITGIDVTSEFTDGDSVRFFKLTGGSANTSFVVDRIISSVAFGGGNTTFTISLALSDRTAGLCFSVTGAGGNSAFACNSGTQGEGNYSFAHGQGGHARLRAQLAHGGGSGLGVNQYSRTILSAFTNDDTTTETTLGGGSPTATNVLTIPANTTMGFHIDIVGRRDSAANENVFMSRRVAIENTGGTTALLSGGIDTIGTDKGSGGGVWTVSLSANDTDDALRVEVAGETGKSISWTVVVHATETIRA